MQKKCRPGAGAAWFLIEFCLLQQLLFLRFKFFLCQDAFVEQILELAKLIGNEFFGDLCDLLLFERFLLRLLLCCSRS